MTASPIAYIIFNRPRHTRETFAVIRAQKPPKLFLIADGPRAGHPTDAENCRLTRDIVAQIDWPCEVHRNFADTNMGCMRRVSSGLDWVFSHVERAIVIEDDCVPNADFFTFCDALLDKYENDPRVWVVTGNNFQNGRRRGNASYYFSKYNHCWGWATWRRAWRHYRVDMPFWHEWKRTADWLRRVPGRVERLFWTDTFDRMSRGEIDTWDYQWTACVWKNGGLTATPNVNLVTNIGFGPDATHTVASGDQQGLPAQSLGILTHPARVKQNLAADRYVFSHHFGGKSHPAALGSRLRWRRDQLLRSPKWVWKNVLKILQRNRSG